MSPLARIVLVAMLATGALAATAGTAAADTIGPIQLLSKDSHEQATEATAPAISADGLFVAFQGSIGGLTGVFREEIATGAIIPVYAVETLAAEEEGQLPAITAPSISAEGGYVSFTTTSRLDPAEDLKEGTSDVYVADLATTPPTYELASALDRPGASCETGVTQPAVGEPDGIEYAGSGGSIASGRVALSEDGREVVFVTTAESNLTQGSGGSTPGVATPAGQVVVRNLTTGCSTLVSAEREPLTGAMTDLPVEGGADIDGAAVKSLRGASISADGSTVAWLGINLQKQVPVLADEEEKFTELAGPYTPYDEPLWRRIGEGPGAPTRRIVGGGDPLAPGCPGTSGTLSMPACQGPFPNIVDYGGGTQNPNSTGWLGAPNVDGVPQLSADGYEVALLGNPTAAANVFLVDMRPGLDRKQAVRQLTRQVPVQPQDEDVAVNKPTSLALNGHVFDLAISADGEQIAFATARQQFPLAPPNLITAAPAEVGLAELYLIDLEGETLQRITHGYKGLGEASQGVASAVGGAGATSPSFGADGRIAFASTAANLVENDGNDAADVFMVEVTHTAKSAGASELLSPPPAGLKSKRLLVSASSLPDGKVRVVAFVPSAGRLSAAASGALAVGAKAHILAKAKAKAKQIGKVKMVLALRGRTRRLAHEPGGFYATARVAFRARAGGAQERRIQVRFRVHKAKHKAKPKQDGSGR